MRTEPTMRWYWSDVTWSNLVRKMEQEPEPMYTQALQDYLAGAGEEALRRAYEFGRQAIGEGLGVMDMVAIHNAAMLQAANLDRNTTGQIEAMQAFLMESLSPFEIAHRSFQETTTTLRRLNETIEGETKRLAHLLHDDATQLLAAVHIALADLAAEIPPPLGGRVQEIRGHLDRVEDQLRHISHELRPTILDDLGLLPALEFLAGGITKRTSLAISVQGSTNGRLTSSIETTLYRSVQEALVNASKHAHATRAMVEVIREPYAIRCSIRDNGGGFNVHETLNQKGQGGLGLLAIRERLNAVGGALQIVSSAQQGTELLISIPLENEK